MLPHPPQELAYRCDGYGDFVLSVNRLDRAKRIDLLLEAAALDPSLEVVIAGDGPDRQRLEALARDRGLDGRARFAGRVSEEELADLYGRCLAVFYAPVDEDFGMVPFEAFLSEKPVLTTTDAGGPLEIVADGRTGLVVAPEAADRRPRDRLASRAPRRGGDIRARGQGDRRRGDLGPCDRRGCSREGRVLQPDAARAHGRGRLQRAAPAGAPRTLDVEVVRRGRKRAPRGVDVALYHVGNNPDAHAWIVDALRRSPGVVVLHDFVLHHLVAGMTVGRRDGHGYLDAMEREHGVVGRLLGHGVLDKRIPPLWESRPEEFPLARFVLQHATGLDRPLADGSRPRARRRVRGPDLGRAAPRVAGARRRAQRVSRGPTVGCFGVVNASKRIPELLRAFAGVRERHPEATLLLVGPTSPGFDLDRRLQRLGLDDEGLVREDWVDERRLWELMAGVRRLASTSGTRRWARRRGASIRSLSLGKPLVVSDVGWFSELPDDVALKVPVDATRSRRSTAALELLVTRDDVRATMGEAAAERSRGASTTSSAWPTSTPPRSRRRPVARSVGDAVLREVSEAAADVGISPEGAEAGEIARRLAEVELG